MTEDVPQDKDTAPAAVPGPAKQSRKGAPPAKRDTLGRQNGLPRNTNAPQTLKPNQRKLMKQQQKP